MQTGLVLSGGGARGIAHLGVIKALQEKKLEIDAVSGTSAGSIVGAFVAAGYEPEEVFEIITKTNFIAAVRPALNIKGLLKMDALGEILKRYLPQDFDHLKIPLTVAATEINEGREYYFSEGPLILPVLASSCIPVIFSPVSFKSGLFIDGGILDNLPVGPLKGKCDFIIGCHTNPIDDNFNAKSFNLLIERTLLLAINKNVIRNKDLCDLFLEPQDLKTYRSLDLGKAKEIFEIGYIYAKEKLEPLALTS